MKKFLASSVLATSVLFPVLVNAEEMQFPQNYTTTQKVEIHNGAMSSDPVVTSINSGQKVTVIDEFTNPSGELWYKLKFGTILGWAKSDQLSKDAVTDSIIPTMQNAIVIQKNTVVRKGANNAYAIVKTLQNGQIVKIIDNFKDSNNQLWYRIEKDGTYGWVTGVSLQAAPAISNLPAIGSYVYSQLNGVVARRGAAPSYASVGSLKLNQKVKVKNQYVSKSGEAWLKIQLTSRVFGWVPANLLSSTQSINLNLYISVDSANLRGGPSVKDSIISEVKKGARLKAITLLKDSKGGIWYKVITNGNSIAWVHQSVVSKQPVSTAVTKYIGTRSALLYSGATFQYKVKQKVPYFSKVTVYKEFTNLSNQTWVNIKTAQGITGWVPKYELVSSKREIKTVYAFNKAAVRKGPLATYAAYVNLKENETVTVLEELNGWLRVETSTGVRGWVDKSLTSPISLKRLITPSTSTVDGDQYFSWNKPYNYKFTYTVLSGNRLKLSGGITDIELPAGNIPGIKSIEKTAINSAEKSVTITFEAGYTFTIRNDANKVSIKIIPVGLTGKKIIIDAGHGGKDTGAIGPTGLREKDANLGTALLLKNELEKYGAIVTLTRSTDVFLELSERTFIANSSDYDAFISIHSDSFRSTSTGSTTYYNSSVNFNGPRSKGMADSIQHNLIASIGTYNRGVLEQGFYVNRMNELPSVLVELAYISNPKEEALLRSTTFRQKAATGVRKGLEEYFNKF